MNYETASYLCHHGVKGMKWGVRKKDKSSGHRKSKSSETSNSRKGLSDKQKKVLKGAAIGAGVVLAAYGGYKLGQVYKDKRIIDLGKSKLSGDIPQDIIEHGFKKLKAKESLADTLSKSNPLKGTPEGKNNCTLAGLAGFIRQRGFDVTAGSTGGKQLNMLGVVEDCFSGARVIDGRATTFGRSKEDASAFLKKKFGDNAEGLCSVQWKGDNGGHTFSYRIRQGVVEFFDNQQGSSNLDSYWQMIDPNGNLQVARLDNAEIKWDKLKKYLR